MKQKIELSIPEPCHENWNKMTATQQGRFCMSCHKEVVDFSVMDDKEILNYISTASKNICGHIHSDQLNRVLQPPYERKQFSFKYLYSILITSFLISNKSNAQVQPPKNKTFSMAVTQTKEVQPIILGGMLSRRVYNEPEYQVNGRVVDENSNPVPYASVVINGRKDGIAADREGFFWYKSKTNFSKIELTVSSVGYITQTVECKKPGKSTIRSAENSVIKIDAGTISLETQVMNEVIVTGYSTTKGKIAIGGAIAVIKKESLVDTIKNAAKNMVKEIAGLNEIKIYPNPVPLNSSFNINFNVKDPGQYNVQFTDASGRVVYTKVVNIVTGKQVENFNINEIQRSGVYFITIRGQAKMYTSELIVQ